MLNGSSEEESTVTLNSQRASEIVKNCKKLPVIAIDLDYTIWEANCYEHTLPPYKSEERSVDGDIVLNCFDRRNMKERFLRLYPDVMEILQWCINHDIVLTICSRSPDQSVVRSILSAFGIWHWFLLPQIFAKRKSYHFRNLVECMELQYRDFLFFDDDGGNVKLCQNLGVACCQVKKSQGLTWQSFLQGLQLFRSSHISRIHLETWVVKTPKANENRLKEPKTITTTREEMVLKRRGSEVEEEIIDLTDEPSTVHDVEEQKNVLDSKKDTKIGFNRLMLKLSVDI